MILYGNQRGGGKALALHLLKEENEHVEIHELRGFVSDNLTGAFHEAYAISRGTKAKQFLFSLSLNPPASKNVSTEVFADAIARIEKKLNLTDQPRAIIFHEKKGRRHCHAVWSRIDAEKMKAIPLSFFKRDLMGISRELYREQGWQMPRGMMNSRERDPRNFTLAQWQQAKRIGKDPRAIKEVFQECWAVSDSQAAFQHALKERGYTLAKGDSRGFVALDHRCEVLSVAKWAGIKAKDVRQKLTNQESLPSVDETRKQIAQEMAQHLNELKKQQDSAIKTRISEIEQKRLQMAQKHARNRSALREAQKEHRTEETRLRQKRFHKGLLGILDRLTGHHRRIRKRNEQETQQARIRDREEKDVLIFNQLDQRRGLQARVRRLEEFRNIRSENLSRDIGQYQEIKDRQRDVAAFDRHSRHSRSPDAPGQER
ncbi:relaxase [bacterium endosymbiont of Escarpia laminata]|nr:MAG: relaxase [bacterium endosymbiont of Escarpia laminata]